MATKQDNLNYLEYIPPSPLDQWIDNLWYCKADKLDNSGLCLPLLQNELIFNFSDHLLLSKGEKSMHNPLVWIQGPLQGSYHSSSSGSHEMMGVLFKINGLKEFMPMEAREVRNEWIDAKDIFGKEVYELAEKLQGTSDVKMKFTLLEQFLMRAARSEQQPNYVTSAMHMLPDAYGAAGFVDRICKEQSISSKSMISSFQKWVGLSPVKYTHLVLINRSLRLLAEDPDQSLTALAYNLGFFDQAHFIRSFKKITSLSPKQYVKHLKQGKVDPTSPNFIFP